ncbi:unnamed protein product [Caretta caretta]
MDPTAEDSWRLEWGDRVYFSHSTVKQAGVATLFSLDLRPEVLGVAEAVPGRLLHLRVRMEGLVVNLVNVYAPTSGLEQLQFYQQASAFLGTLDSHECLVLGGDFNTTLEEWEEGPSRTIGPGVPLFDPASTSFRRWITAPASSMPWRKRGGPTNTSSASWQKMAPPSRNRWRCVGGPEPSTRLFSLDLTDPSACRVLWEELPTVSVSNRDRLELPLTLAEFSEALRRMPTNKSPGMDGLTLEFCHVFWDVLGPDLVTV